MSRELFKNLQGAVAQQCPQTKFVLDIAAEAVKVFTNGLEACEDSLDYMAFDVSNFPGDPERLRMASELDCLKTAVANNLKYDYPNISDRYDLDCTTEDYESGVRVWLHARNKKSSTPNIKDDDSITA